MYDMGYGKEEVCSHIILQIRGVCICVCMYICMNEWMTAISYSILSASRGGERKKVTIYQVPKLVPD